MRTCPQHIRETFKIKNPFEEAPQQTEFGSGTGNQIYTKILQTLTGILPIILMIRSNWTSLGVKTQAATQRKPIP
jgi:hypothetical protein